MTVDRTQIQAVDAYWRAANYLAAGMIHLRRNPLADELTKEDVKRRILGHWGSSPGQAFIWAHANNLLLKNPELRMIYLSGPGHGAPGMIGPVWLDGDYTRVYPEVTRDAKGMGLLFERFSAPGGIGSHCTPETPGSIHEGGELGYVLSHAAGAVLDNPELIALACVGDGEAETGPLATAWNVCKLLRPGKDGVVLPVLHLNGYKIANPTMLARIPNHQLTELFRGYGWEPLFVEHQVHATTTHWAMAAAMEQAAARIEHYQRHPDREYKLPLIVLRTPKGWSGPKEVGGKKVEGSWRAHQVPLPKANADDEQFQQLRDWLASYAPEELFDAEGRPTELVLANVPETTIAAPDYTEPTYVGLNGLDVAGFEVPLTAKYENTKALGRLCEALYRRNPHFRVFGPDETASNRLQDVYAATKKLWRAGYDADDANGTELSKDGRVIEMLSEHTLVGMLEGYLMTGGHGLFHTYEAFAHVISSMALQHGKWLAATREHADWRPDLGSWNCLLSSTVWRQDHNGGTHQQPGFIHLATQMDPATVRVYMPADANTLLAVAEKAFAEPNVVNFIVSDKQAHEQFFTLEQGRELVAKGAAIYSDDGDPDVVLAATGDVTFQETVRAAENLRAAGYRVRVVHVTCPLALAKGNPMSLTDEEFEDLFPWRTPVVFNHHGYANWIKELIYDRCRVWHLHGFQEKGSINTPLELCIINEVDRFTITQDAAEILDGWDLVDEMEEAKQEALAYAYENGVDREM